MRLYELAKELGLTSRKLLSFFKSKNVVLKSNLVKVSDEQAELARKTFARRVKLMQSEEILKKAREEEKKEREKRKKEEEKKKREEEKKRKAEQKAKEKEKKKKKAAAKKKPTKKAKPKGKTVADKVAEKLSKARKAAPPAKKKKKKSKKAKVEEVEEETADETPVIQLGDEAEELDEDDLRRKVLELEEEARRREEREEKRASFLKRRQGWGVDGGRGRARPRRRHTRRKFSRRSTPTKHVRPENAIIELPVTVRTLSSAIGVKVRDIIGFLLRKGTRVNINSPLEQETAEEIGLEFGVEVEIKQAPDVEDYLASLEHLPAEEEDLVSRPPVITMLGHVDHGKTSLLDRIRQTNVHEQEAGGITQHISAYRIEVNGQELVFVDTPGHEAFTEMRARGANVTDLVVLVVAADDGVMPQTEEAIDHAKAAGVPIVVALNKIDRPNANPLKAKQQLATLGFTSEEWGGETVVVEVSAVTGQGIDDLLEMLVLSAEMLDLKANPKRPAMGTVLEAKLSSGVGVAATAVVKDGTLRVGDDVIAGSSIGRVRAMYDMEGRQIEEALPAWPIQVTGLSEVPGAGDRFYVVDDVQKAREAVDQRKEKSRAESVVTREAVTLENLFERFQAGKTKELRIVLKADVRGTADVIKATLEELSTDEVKVRILHIGVGSINESDVLLADASEAIVVGFTVKVDEKAGDLAEEKKVDVRIYEVIYELTSEVKAAMEGLLEPEEREVITGHCEVRQSFRSSRLGVIAGCFVLDGYVTRNSRVRLKREDDTVFEGSLDSLRRFKDDVREVKEGFECGMKLSGCDDVRVGDVIETYEIEKVARKLQ
jgi:translation initiation factor IF-2